MTKNKLSDLQNLLFAELERLDDEELTDEEVQKEARRASAVKGVAEENHQGQSACTGSI